MEGGRRRLAGHSHDSLDTLSAAGDLEIVEHGHDRDILSLGDPGKEQRGIGQIDHRPRLLLAAALLPLAATASAATVTSHAAVAAVASLTDPAKLSTLKKGERAANPRLKKAVCWLAEARLREDHGVTVVGIQSPSGGFAEVTPDTVLGEGCVLLLAGPTDAVTRFTRSAG